MGYKYIILEGFGQTDRREYDLGLIEEWESKGVHPNDIEQFNKELKLPKSWKKVRYAGAVYPIKKKVNSQTGDSSEIAFWRKLVKLLYDDKYIIVPANGEGNLGYVLYHLLNRGDTEKVVLCNDSYTNRYTQDSIDRVYDYFCEHKRETLLNYLEYRDIPLNGCCSPLHYCSELQENISIITLITPYGNFTAVYLGCPQIRR